MGLAGNCPASAPRKKGRGALAGAQVGSAPRQGGARAIPPVPSTLLTRFPKMRIGREVVERLVLLLLF